MLCGEPGVGTIAPMVGEVRRSVLLAQKERDGIRARHLKRPRTEFGYGDHIEVLKNDLTAAGIDAVAIGKDTCRKDDRRDTAWFQKLRGAFHKERLNGIVLRNIRDALCEIIA